MKPILVVILLLLSACAQAPAQKQEAWYGLGRWFTPESEVQVAEAGRSQQCHTEDTESKVRLFVSLAEVRAWEAGSGVSVAGEQAAESAYALVEMGRRNTGGYGIAISREAGKRGDELWLRATYVSPAPGRMVTQALTAPCVLVSLPQAFRKLNVQDQSGQVRAKMGK